jgi:phosphohistidine phosphatase
MKLYILRHAIAVHRGTPNVEDDARPLTEDGVRKMKKAAAGLKSLGLAPEVILSSPLERAKQTAEIVRGTVGAMAELRLIPALSPSGHRDDVFQEIREYTSARELMLIGHQPSLGEIAGEIAFRSSACFVELRKGGICAIELDRLSPTPRGTLLWLLTPSVLRSLR